MLCGAADTNGFYEPFRQVISSVGGDALYYQSGRIVYRNSLVSTFAGNSRNTVQRVDACVFVINEKYGEITWSVELEQALEAGKPFAVLCRDTTYQTYDIIRRRDPSDRLDKNERQLVAALDRFTSRNLTLHTFSLFQFETELRLALSQLFEHGLTALQSETLRHNALAVADRTDLTPSQLDRLRGIALDETEEKNARKRALHSLANNRGLDSTTLLDLLDSVEQGVQRTVLQNLDRLYQQRPVESEFLVECVELANRNDDVGFVRRLVPAMFALDLEAALQATRSLHLEEIGAKRRLANAIEDHEQDIRAVGLQRLAAEAGRRCVEKTSDVGWVARCRDILERFEADFGSSPPPPPTDVYSNTPSVSRNNL